MASELEFECLGDVDISQVLEYTRYSIKDVLEDSPEIDMYSEDYGHIDYMFSVKPDILLYDFLENRFYWERKKIYWEKEQARFKTKFDPDFAAKALTP